MKKALLFLTIFSLFISCDDGDFDVPSFEFQNNIGSCGEYVLYRLSSSSTEAFIITLTTGDIQNVVETRETAITNSNVNYRAFSGAVDASTYFCATIPPTTPTVSRNWEAVAGPNNKITITTTAITDTSGTITAYNHEIVLENLVLESSGETITYDTYTFGSVQTTP